MAAGMAASIARVREVTADSWQDRADAVRRRRVSRGARVDWSGCEPDKPMGSTRFDYAADNAEHPFTWWPAESDTLVAPELKPGDLDSLSEQERARRVVALYLPGASGAVRVEAKPRRPTQKSTRPAHSISQRRQAIARHEAGESYATLAAEYGVPRSTIVNWCRRGLAPSIEQLNTPREEAA